MHGALNDTQAAPAVMATPETPPDQQFAGDLIDRANQAQANAEVLEAQAREQRRIERAARVAIQSIEEDLSPNQSAGQIG